MSQWQNPPHRGFSVDPVTAPTLRPSSSDRDYADSTLRMAHAEGRLTDAELAERVERADSAWSLKELSDVIADVSVPTMAGANLAAMPVSSMPPIVSQLDPARRSARIVLTRAFLSWLGMAVVFNVIWIATGGLGHYYWPVWPMLGTALPLIGLVGARFGPDPAPVRREDPPTDLR